jgi:hypothetical protein
VAVYWLIGGACLFVGWLIGWWFGYDRGKKDGLLELNRAEAHERLQKIQAYRNRDKKPVQDGQNRNKKR